MVREALPILSDLMIVTHLSGMKKTPQSLALSVFDKTIQSYKKSLNVDIGKLQAQYRTRAFALLNDVADTIEKDLRTTTLNLIEQGATPKEAQATLRGRFDDLGLTDKKDYQLRTIFRTQSQIAYSAGRWQADQDPAIQEILWGYEYSAVGDDRTRESHMAMDGTTLPKDDPFWQTHWPPNGYNCRCIAIPIYADSVQDVPPPDDAEADDGFDFNAGEVFDGAIALSHYVEGWSFAFDS
jgi:SPP1 gp7 family putative phage head morphogenesis protein